MTVQHIADLEAARRTAISVAQVAHLHKSLVPCRPPLAWYALGGVPARSGMDRRCSRSSRPALVSLTTRMRLRDVLSRVRDDSCSRGAF